MNIYKEFTLTQNQYISDIAHDMELNNGINLIIADVGTGKSHYFSKLTNTAFAAPLVSIVSSIDGTSVSTWNALVGRFHATSDKGTFKNEVLVVDECHGFFTDYSYKGKVIRDLVAIFPYFKSVILMSGTIKQEYLNSVSVDRVYRVRKPSQAVKEYRQYNYKKSGKAFLESLIMSNKGKRKAIALVNDIKLCKRIASSYGDKALVVSSEVKETEEVQSFFTAKRMDHYELIIGTDSIREGLSIEDDLDEVDIYIYGHTDPDGIEQFTNRFRNVHSVKTLHYITPVRDSKSMKDFSVEGYVDDANHAVEALTVAYTGFSNDLFREHFRTQYSQDIKGCHVRYMKEFDGFVIDKLSIDAIYAEYRAKQCEHDPVLFQMRMSEYDFKYRSTQVVEGNEALAQDIKEELKEIKLVEKKEREEILSSLIDSFCTGKYEYAGKHEEYDALRESIVKLQKVGLKDSQIELVVNGVIDDKTFISRVWADYNYVEEQSNIRNMILNYIAKECPDDVLTKMDLYVLSNMILKKVLSELFKDDHKAMRKNSLWSKWVEYEGGKLVVRDKCQTKVINRYITLDKPVRRKTSQCTDRMYKALLEMKKLENFYEYPVKYTNLTGFSIDKVNVVTEQIKQEVQQASDLKAKMMKMAGVFA
ncbi:hypothetical protein IGU62_002094 [Escherichia coli]|nr:hypothetical protein [Escherichia coli]EIP3499167.1 hypothetical protein [Escherichia coli]EKH9549080.1 hypothetical protein [Escherichia coli]EMB0435172.1 hypothetical protein [Escherichia coli]NJU52072.1 hypothetical protein [Escherichia coli]